MNKKRILVVDDERDLCEILCYNLSAAGYDATSASSAEEAFSILAARSFDLLLLDVMLPGLSGFELASQLRQHQSAAAIPIIFLTAKDTEADLLQGFSLGADDYVTKPFSVREVMARVKAVLSRSGVGMQRVAEASAACILAYEGLIIDGISKRVTIDGTEIALTKTEYELLSLLLSRRGEVLSRQQLLEGAWPQHVVVTGRTVDVTIARLRKKIGVYAAHIVARTGFWYSFEN